MEGGYFGKVGEKIPCKAALFSIGWSRRTGCVQQIEDALTVKFWEILCTAVSKRDLQRAKLSRVGIMVRTLYLTLRTIHSSAHEAKETDNSRNCDFDQLC